MTPNPSSKTENLIAASSSSSNGVHANGIKGAKVPTAVVPEKVPTLAELKRIIPARCFQPTLRESFFFVIKDITLVSIIYASMFFLTERPDVIQLPWVVKWFLVMPIYWMAQGLMFSAVFVLAHDCGHGSFSTSSFINDLVGNTLHTFLMVPYYPWKLSHHRHHKNTGNIDKDEIFYPIRESDRRNVLNRRVFEPQRYPYFGFGLGWFVYLITGYAPRFNNHYNPSDPMFVRHFYKCALSLAFMAVWVTFGVMPYWTAFGTGKLFAHYGVPLFLYATALVMVTFLHHHDEKTQVPWYSDDNWDFVRGQLSSVDRNYGPVLHHLVHNIGTHQLHHLFIKIPHYRLEEATRAFRKEYPQLVRRSRALVPVAFFRMFHIFAKQQFIGDDVKVHVYKKTE